MISQTVTIKMMSLNKIYLIKFKKYYVYDTF